MASERAKMRGAVLVEDRRSERFIRALLTHLGFQKNRIDFQIAPARHGAASHWVIKQFPAEVDLLRKKRQAFFLIAMVDGDNVGVNGRKAEFDNALKEAGLEARQLGEIIATPIPTWSIETWLLALLGDNETDESKSGKFAFENAYRRNEREALRSAVMEWHSRCAVAVRVPSLMDGKMEIERLYVS
jgi:hypothetical protein